MTETSVGSPVFTVGVASVWVEPSCTNGLISSDADCGWAVGVASWVYVGKLRGCVGVCVGVECCCGVVGV